jgi:hypothetical protein
VRERRGSLAALREGRVVPSALTDLELVPGVLGERAEGLGALALVIHRSDRFADGELVEEAA